MKSDKNYFDFLEKVYVTGPFLVYHQYCPKMLTFTVFNKCHCVIQKLTIEGFNVTSYQANVASHHIRDRHVGFLLAWHGIGKYNKMFRHHLFSLYHNTKLQQSDKKWNISPHSV